MNTSFTRWLALSFVLALAAQTGAHPTSAQNKPNRPPNIVFILADDLGWTDVACFGSKYYETPNLDRLAAQGLKFTSAYTAAPNCSPTRASLMTGMYTPRHGIWTAIGGAGDQPPPPTAKLIPAPNGKRLPLEFTTIAQALKASGYATGMFGKWHLGQQGDYHPAKRGFDEAIESMGRHFGFRTNPPTPTAPNEYLADFLAARAEGFIERHKDQPFFLYLPHFAVHSPHEAKPELIAKYEKKPAAGGHRNPTYAAMIDSLDQAVGRVMAKLDALGLRDNTVLIFSSDNGGVGGYTVNDGRPENRNTTANAPARGGKGQLYEGGVRVPLLVRWPSVVKAGTMTAQPVISVDFFPTFLQLAQSKENPAQPRDGISLLPLLKSSGQARLNRPTLYWNFPGYLPGRTTPVSSIRDGDWKLIEFFEDGKLELYNLAEDLSERNDLAAKLPAKTRELHGKLQAWRAAVKAPLPTPKPQTN